MWWTAVGCAGNAWWARQRKDEKVRFRVAALVRGGCCRTQQQQCDEEQLEPTQLVTHGVGLVLLEQLEKQLVLLGDVDVHVLDLPPGQLFPRLQMQGKVSRSEDPSEK